MSDNLEKLITEKKEAEETGKIKKAERIEEKIKALTIRLRDYWHKEFNFL